MDLVLNVADNYFFTPYVYPTSWPEDEPVRQIIGLLVVTNISAALLYLGLGALSYFFIFDHTLMKHPQFLEVTTQFISICKLNKAQIRHELIKLAASINYQQTWSPKCFLCRYRLQTLD